MAGIGDVFDTTEALSRRIVEPDANLGPFGKLGKKILRKMCDGYSTDPGAFQVPGGPGRPEYDEVCNPYYDEIGATPPNYSPPFTGGQCVGATYRATGGFSPNQFYPNGVAFNPTDMVGPIRNFNVDIQTAGNGNKLYNATVQNGDPAAPQTVSLGGMTVTPGTTVTWNFGVVSIGNSPNNCGNPDPVATPGTAPIYNFNTEVNIDVDGRTYNTTINSPTINNVDKSLTIPVIITGGINLDLGVPGGSVPESAPVANGKPPVFSGPEIPKGESEAGNGEFPDPPSGKKYVGAYIELLDMVTPESGIIGPLPNIVWPFVVANATLLYATSGISRILDGYRPIREDAFTLVRPSEGVEVIGCKVALSYPGSYRITPLLIDEESTDA